MPQDEPHGQSQQPRLPHVTIRAAVLHFIELAAAYEGEGHSPAFHVRADVRANKACGPAQREDHEPAFSFEEDLACLSEVVERLLRHRNGQRALQRNALLWNIHIALAGLYREHRANPDATADALQKEIQRLCLADFVEPTEALLDAFVLEQSEISADGGPIEAARKAVAKAVGLSEGTIGDIRRKALPWDEARRAFGRWVSRERRRAYALRLHDELLNETEDLRLRPTDLSELCEAAGCVLDRRFEMILYLSLHEHTAFTRMFENAPSREQLLATAEAECLRLRGVTRNALVSDAVELTGLPDEVRRAALRLHGIQGLGSTEVERAERDLEMAIQRAGSARALETLDALMAKAAEALGPVDSPPRVGIATK